MNPRSPKTAFASTSTVTPHLRAELARQRTKYVKAIVDLLDVSPQDAELALVAARMAASMAQDKRIKLPRWAYLQLPDLFERFADVMLSQGALPDVASGDFDAADPECAELVAVLRQDRGLAHILDTAAERGQLGAHVVLSVAFDQALVRRIEAQLAGVC